MPVQISGRDLATIVSKLPILLDNADRTDNTRYENAKRMLANLHRRLTRKLTDINTERQ